MAVLTVIPLIGTLGILFIGFNVIIITLLILTIVFGVIRAIKKKFNKTFIVLLIVTILFGILDFFIINNLIKSFNEINISNDDSINIRQEDGKTILSDNPIEQLFMSDDKKTEIICNDIMNKIETKDYETIKSIFSKDAINNIENLDDGINELINISNEGIIDFKRTDFLRMINDALNGKIDLILTKSIARFARNTVDTLKYVRMLKEKNVAIYFEEEHINTLEMAGELLLTILSSVAQQEVQNTSDNVKLGLKMKMQRGEMVGANNCYGYEIDKEKKTLKIIEEEAKVVRKIFELYIDGYGTKGIADCLEAEKIKTRKGHTEWSTATITRILKNEKYIGDLLMRKSITIDPIAKKRIPNNGEEDKYYVKNHHPAIISRETFEKAQKIRASRSKDYTK